MSTAADRNGRAGSALPPPANIMVPEGRTDIAVAQRFVEEHGENILWCDPWSKWLIWDGRWTCVDNRLAYDWSTMRHLK